MAVTCRKEVHIMSPSTLQLPNMVYSWSQCLNHIDRFNPNFLVPAQSLIYVLNFNHLHFLNTTTTSKNSLHLCLNSLSRNFLLQVLGAAIFVIFSSTCEEHTPFTCGTEWNDPWLSMSLCLKLLFIGDRLEAITQNWQLWDSKCSIESTHKHWSLGQCEQ